MYDQKVVMFIHEFLNNSASEISRITNLHASEIPALVETTKKQLLAALKADFGPFLADSFHLMEQIIDENIDENIGGYPSKLHEVEKLIINQYRHLEVEMQSGLSKATNVNEFKTILMNQNSALATNLRQIEKTNNSAAMMDAEKTFIGIETKVNAYFVSIGLTNESICREIKQIIDIHEHNLLSKIDDKIPALTYTGNDNVQLLFNTVLSNIMAPKTVVSTTSNETPDIPMFKM